MGTSTESVGAAQQIAMHKKIAITTGQTSHKEGFAYFNEIFMKRHASLLTKSAKRTALVEMGILLAVLAACFYFYGDCQKNKSNTIFIIR